MIGDRLAAVVNIIFNLAYFAILAQVLLSWVLQGRLVRSSSSMFPYLIRIYELLRQITDPILQPIRRFTTFGMMDFSPIVALILLEIIRGVLVTALKGSL